ncbi:hypothetical protein THASP1DRAFT_23736 [Thamnocephalis sphaerospora]|uniref:Uncharacterized protein n=1 Tax=Thamnocephalis sphaerospora TaxID=78915 RepID=A0A4P9XQC8_9FUNG|nr:hypothetical protein THASP1DRAFT_23736 [Thamnocephalis sphaerospora]|eukprot:RKP08244.1 hypothetical protein THASP1DRAFT_23736 [Thamnocephalis sphaerospora]
MLSKDMHIKIVKTAQQNALVSDFSPFDVDVKSICKAIANEYETASVVAIRPNKHALMRFRDGVDLADVAENLTTFVDIPEVPGNRKPTNPGSRKRKLSFPGG